MTAIRKAIDLLNRRIAEHPHNEYYKNIRNWLVQFAKEELDFFHDETMELGYEPFSNIGVKYIEDLEHVASEKALCPASRGTGGLHEQNTKLGESTCTGVTQSASEKASLRKAMKQEIRLGLPLMTPTCMHCGKPMRKAYDKIAKTHTGDIWEWDCECHPRHMRLSVL